MKDLIASCSVEIEGAPEWVHLLPLGELKPFDGREPWEVDAPEQIVALSAERGIDLVVDYDHQTDKQKPIGGPAPAAGWIKELEVRADGVWGRVEWTEKGQAMLSAKEYKYLSPVFRYTKSRKVTRILRAALTNDPALSDLTALASAEHGEPTLKKLLERIQDTLGLEGEVSEDALCSAIAALKTTADNAVKVSTDVATQLKLKSDASGEEIGAALASAITATAPDPTKYVPMETFTEVSGKLNDLQQTTRQAEASALVDAAVEAGKISPATKEWATAYASSDPEGFKSYVEVAPEIAGDTPTGGQPEGGASLTAEEIATCNAMGITQEDFKKQKEEDAKK